MIRKGLFCRRGAVPVSIAYYNAVLEGTLIGGGVNGAGTHRVDCFVKRRKNPRLPDRWRDAMPIHVGSQVRTDACKDHLYMLLVQFSEEITYGPCSGVVDICD